MKITTMSATNLLPLYTVSVVHSWFASKVIPQKTDHKGTRITPTSELENRCSIQLSYGSNLKFIPVISTYFRRVDDFLKTPLPFLLPLYTGKGE